MSSTEESSSAPITIRVSYKDVFDQRAYLRIPGEGKIKLCHMAGAPWNEKVPDAELHDGQKETLCRKEREKILHGGSRYGKSVVGGCEGVCEAILPLTKTGVIAQRFDHVAAEFQYIYKGMIQLFKDHPQAFRRVVFKHQAAYHDYDIDTIWGSRVRGWSVESDEGAALLGQEFSRIIIGEGSHVSKVILEKRVWRALDGWLMQSKDGYVREGGYLSIYTTPKGYEGCSAAEWDRVRAATRNRPELLHYGRVQFPKTVWVREAAVSENPYFDKSVMEIQKDRLSKSAFDEQYLGKMTFKTGRVIPSFHEDKHVVKLPDVDAIRKMRLGVGIDTGAYTGIVLAGIDPKRRKWALGNVYTQQVRIDESLEELRHMIVEVLGPVFLTDQFQQLKEQIDVWVIDPAAGNKLEIMHDLGDDIALTSSLAPEGGKLELIPSVERVDRWFESDSARVVDHCDDLVDQIRRYVWKQKKAAGRGAASAPVVIEPRKEYDHVIDACRYIWEMLDQMGPRDEPPSLLSFSQAWEQHHKSAIFGDLSRQLEEARIREELLG